MSLCLRPLQRRRPRRHAPVPLRFRMPRSLRRGCCSSSRRMGRLCRPWEAGVQAEEEEVVVVVMVEEEEGEVVVVVARAGMAVGVRVVTGVRATAAAARTSATTRTAAAPRRTAQAPPRAAGLSSLPQAAASSATAARARRSPLVRSSFVSIASVQSEIVSICSSQSRDLHRHALPRSRRLPCGHSPRGSG